MGQNVKWTSAECAALASGWLKATINPAVGTGQKGTAFWQQVFDAFASKTPDNFQPGTYKERDVENAIKQYRDKMSKDMMLFLASHRRVFLAPPTGTTQQEKINIAVALHKKRASSPHHKYKDFNPDEWTFYRAWLIVNTQPKYKPNLGFVPADSDALRIVNDRGVVNVAAVANAFGVSVDDIPNVNNEGNGAVSVNSVEHSTTMPTPTVARMEAASLTASVDEANSASGIIDIGVVGVATNGGSNVWSTPMAGNRMDNDGRTEPGSALAMAGTTNGRPIAVAATAVAATTPVPTAATAPVPSAANASVPTAATVQGQTAVTTTTNSHPTRGKEVGQKMAKRLASLDAQRARAEETSKRVCKNLEENKLMVQNYLTKKAALDAKHSRMKELRTYIALTKGDEEAAENRNKALAELRKLCMP
jgi:hypothetical protein